MAYYFKGKVVIAVETIDNLLTENLRLKLPVTVDRH